MPAGQPVAKKLITPPVKVTGSVGAWTNNPYSRLEDYNFGSHARTLKTLGYGDNITFTFAGPVECEQIELVTGYSYLPRCILMSGYVELLYAGDKEFQHYGTFKDGALTISPDKAVKALRIVSTQRTNGEKSVIIQPLRIVAK